MSLNLILADAIASDAFAARLKSKIDAEAGDDACWPWAGARTALGYGQIRWRGKAIYTHRAVAFMAARRAPGPQEVMHVCDNPPCCNPRHLRIGTHADNMRDCAVKGRKNQARGEASGTAKVTPDLVRYVRASYPAKTQGELAAEMGLHPSSVSDIVRRVTWRHVT